MSQQPLRTVDTSGSGTRKEVEAAKKVRKPNDATHEDDKLEKRVK